MLQMIIINTMYVNKYMHTWRGSNPLGVNSRGLASILGGVWRQFWGFGVISGGSLASISESMVSIFGL